MVKIALFGTSADPPTAAHQAILNWLSSRYDLVVVWASDNPLKSHQTPLKHRWQMLKLLIEDISTFQGNIGLYQNLSSPRTLETVQQAKQHWGKEADLTLVIGSDLINQIPRWYQVEKLFKEVKLLVVTRPGYAINQEGIEILRKLGANVDIAELELPAVSSTAYREKGETEAVTPPVKAYIHQEQLYACQNKAPSQ